MDMRHTFSIDANDSKSTIEEVVRHLLATAYKTKIEDIYDGPILNPRVQHILNLHKSFETPFPP